MPLSTSDSLTPLFRLSGLSLLLGGVTGVVAIGAHPSNTVDPANVPVHLALYTAVMLIALGLPGLYAAQAARTAVLGIIALVVLFLGVVFTDPIHSVLEMTVVPVLAADPTTRPILDGPPPGLMGPLMIAIPVLLLGLLLTAIASIRAEALPRWPSYIAIAAILTVPLSLAVSEPEGGDSPIGKIGPALVYLSMAAFGYVLTASRSERVSTAPARPALDRDPATVTR